MSNSLRRIIEKFRQKAKVGSSSPSSPGARVATVSNPDVELVPTVTIPISRLNLDKMDEETKGIVYPILYNAINHQIEQILKEDKRLLQSLSQIMAEYRRKEKLAEEIHQRKIRRMAEIIWFTNRFEALGLLGLLILLLGTGIGINLPPVIGCHSEHTPCWHIRLRENKQILK